MNVNQCDHKLKLDLSFSNKLEKCCLYTLVFIPYNKKKRQTLVPIFSNITIIIDSSNYSEFSSDLNIMVMVINRIRLELV